ncbi:hypothetical protein CIB48_g8674 [Xylaria polymorpha]|nr:hypothetical protein CIB48_g8674 [Xylaria polymorpha]
MQHTYSTAQHALLTGAAFTVAVALSRLPPIVIKRSAPINTSTTLQHILDSPSRPESEDGIGVCNVLNFQMVFEHDLDQDQKEQWKHVYHPLGSNGFFPVQNPVSDP